MKKVITILAIATFFSCSTDEIPTTEPTSNNITPIENQVRYEYKNDTITIQNKFWLGVSQTKTYSIFATGLGRTLDVTSNLSNSKFFTTDNFARIYSIVSQYKVSKTKLKYVNNVLTETTQIGNQYVMTTTAFNNTHTLKFDTIANTYIDANGNSWIVN
jgi:hypothetical protein